MCILGVYLRGDAAENVEMAIAANQSALQVYTKEAFPQHWAQVHMNLANAYLHRIHGDRSKNLEKAIAAHQSALQVLTRDEFPRQWAMTRMNLGNVFLEQRKLDKAVEYVERSRSKRLVDLMASNDFYSVITK